VGTTAAYQAATGWSSFSSITDDATSGISPSAAGSSELRIAGGMLQVGAGGNPLVKVYSISGRLVLQQRGSSIDVSAIAQGVYIVEVERIRTKVVK
jgi:hypothetical protein